MPLKERLVACRAPGCVQRDEVERRSISCAVVRRMRHQFEMREFTAPQFVENLAWLSIPVRIIDRRLKRAKEFQRPAREMRINQNVLQRDKQADLVQTARQTKEVRRQA